MIEYTHTTSLFWEGRTEGSRLRSHLDQERQ